MKVPALFYGTARQASTKVRAVAKRIAKAKAYSHVSYGDLLDTRDVPGVVLVNKEFDPSSDPNFHCYLFSEELVDCTATGEAHRALEQWLSSSLEDAASFLCTLGGFSNWGIHDAEPELSRRYVDAAIKHWEAFKLEKERFGPVLSSDESLPHIWITLFAAIEKLGLPMLERIPHLGAPPDVLLRVLLEFQQRKPGES